ncbi:MAG TPA: S8 family serine peptidase [Chloroflexota bacterium]|nr:S8 family serine peptidase [Chloroflexota bacterium]
MQGRTIVGRFAVALTLLMATVVQVTPVASYAAGTPTATTTATSTPAATGTATPAATSAATSTPSATPTPSPQASTSSILVTFNASSSDSTTENAVVAAVGGTIETNFTPIDTLVIDVTPGTESQMVAAYAARSEVQSAQLNYTLTKTSLPNDPGYSQQWALHTISWDQAYGSITPTGTANIAVLDTGIDATHPDLSGVVNTGAGKSEVGTDPNTDPNGHGTEMAGIAAASVNNSIGMAGVDYAGASLTSIQVLASDGTGTDSNVIAGVFDAEKAGANVILMAFSSPGYSSALNSAIQNAESKGIVVVAATGNSASTVATYPAGDPGVLGVTATDQNDNLLSTDDLVSADVAAPGAGIYTTQPGGAYGTVSGTSPAAAEVAGLAGLLVANGDTASQVYNQITGATDPLSGQTFGRINVLKALGASATVTPQPTVSASPTPAASPTYVAASTVSDVSGHIYQGSGTSLPIQGVSVTCAQGCNTPPPSITTDSSGKYDLGKLTFAGSAQMVICARKIGFNPQIALIQFNNGSNPAVTVDFHMATGTDASCPSSTSNGTPTQIAFTSLPYTGSPNNPDLTAGVASGYMTVQLEDSAGNPIVPATSHTVTLTSDSPGTHSFNPASLTISASSSASFKYTDDKSGTPTITATDSTLAHSTATQQETVDSAAAANLVFGQQPSNAQAGLPVTPAVTVDVEDQYGNLVTSSTASVSLAFTSGHNPGSSTLSNSSTNAASGVATFGALSVNNPGVSYEIQATSGGLNSATSSTFDVSQIVLAPSSGPTGQAVTVTGGGFTASGSSTVILTWNTASGTQLTKCSTDSTGAIAGTCGFTIPKDVAGSHTVTAADTSHTATATFTINPSIRLNPSSGAAGSTNNQLTGTGFAASSTVTATWDGGTLAISGTCSTDSSGNLPSSGSCTYTVPGNATVGNHTIVITDASGNVAQATFNVTVGAVAKFVVSTINSTTAGSALYTGTNSGAGFTVTAEDANNNVVTGYTGTISVAITSGTGTSGASLSGTTTQPANSGVATFTGVSITTAGTNYALTATGTTTSSTGTSNQFTISAGPVSATTSTVVANPTSVVADGTHSSTITVTLMDQYGNPVSNKSVSLAQNTGAHSVVTTGTNPTNSNGQATFTATDTTAETVTYTATDSTDSTQLNTQPKVTFTAGAVSASKSTVVANPTSVVADGSHTSTITVTLLDANGNPVSNKTVSLGQGSGSSTITTVTGTTGTNGQASFTVKDTKAESVTYTATDSSDGLPLSQTAQVTFTPGTATQLVFVNQPTNTTAGQTIGGSNGVTAQFEDANGNVETGDNSSSVSIAIGTNPGSGTLSGTTSVTVSAGVATFGNLSINKVGTGYTLIASSGSITSSPSNAFTITPAAAAKLVFGQQPSNTKSNLAISPAVTVQIQDQFGNLETGDNATSVAIAIGANANSGTLSGTTTQTVSGGVAAFSNLSIDNAGTGYALKATSGTLTSATSVAFNITARSTTTSVSCTPSTVDANQGTTCTATVTDTDTSPAITPTGSVSFTVSPSTNGSFSNSANCTLSGTGSSATCTVTYTPSVVSTPQPAISAGYAGDGPHSASNTTSAFTVTVNLRPTTTSVSCAASTVTINSGTTCTATVTDTDGNGTKLAPGGSVIWTVSPSSNGGFTSSAGSTFTAGPPPSCTLISQSSSAAACSVTYTASTYGSPAITAAYNGADNAHATSNNNGSPYSLTATVGLCAGATTTALAMCGVSMTAPFASETLTGQDLSDFASLSNINVQDQQSSGTAGWNVTVQASQLTCTGNAGCPNGGDKLQPGNLLMGGPLAQGPNGSQCVSGCNTGTLTLPRGTTPFAIDTGDLNGGTCASSLGCAPVKIASYAGGDASYTFVPGTVDNVSGHNLKMTVPADAYASTYNTTITLTVATGP